MTHLRGMIVRIRTENQAWAGTDDPLYIGVYGKGGGREFNLDVANYNDFERGDDDRYLLGTVWDGTVIPGTMNPKSSTPGGRNNPAWHRINLDLVDYVYIRKAGSKSTSGDDAFKFDLVEVTLYGQNPESRTFSQSEDLWLANEYGQISYLIEE